MKKVAIVTGASRGIGRAVAKRLAQDGFTVVVNYMTNAAEAEEVVAELKGIGGNAVAIQADVSSPPDVERLLNETNTKFGSVDVVVHNSGIMPLRLLARMTSTSSIKLSPPTCAEPSWCWRTPRST